MKRFVMAFCILFSVSAVADFNRTSGLIDIPTARILPHLGYRFGLDVSVRLNSDCVDKAFEENLHAALGYGDFFEGYIDVYTFKDFTAAAGFCHRFYDQGDFALGWGLHTLSWDTDVSEVGHGDSMNFVDELYYSGGYHKPFELASVFIVSSFSPHPNLDFTVGLGRGDFVGYGPHSKYFNTNFYHDEGGDWAIGAFVGAEFKPIKYLSLMTEVDARDYNVGLCFRYLPIEIGVALTKIEHLIWPGETQELSSRIAFSVSFMRSEERAKTAVIAGTVSDEKDGKPLGAEVGFLHSDIPKVITKAEIGTFRFTDLKPGIYELYTTTRGYIGQKKKVGVSAGRTVLIDFELTKKEEKPKTGDLSGIVRDMETSKPIAATLTIEEIGKTFSCGIRGAYQFKNLEPNVYRIKAEADGYETGFYPAVVNAGVKNETDIFMIKRGMVITIEGIKFDLNKATIRPESYPILDNAAAILSNHPDINVEIQGHTCSLGSDSYNLKLSNARANSVRRYLIKNHDIESTRLRSRGYGERRPIADNRTETGRMQNRRVDFLILK